MASPGVALADDPEPAASSGGLTVDEALAEAAQTGRPVDIASYTTETQSVAAEPDGKLALTQSLAPVRKRVGTQWKTLDASMRENVDGSYSPAVSMAGLELSGGGNGPLATMYVSGSSLSLSVPWTLPVPTVSGSTATYAEVLPGVDLVASGDAFGSVSEVFVIHDAKAAQNAALRSVRWTTSTVGLTLSADAAGNIVGRNAAGVELVTASAPVMWDSREDGTHATTTDSSGTVVDASSGDPITSSAKAAGADAAVAPVRVAVDSGGLTLTPDAALLDSPSTVYPLYIDPGFTAPQKPASSVSTSWTYVASNYPATSYWKDSKLKVGYEGWEAPYFKARSFLQLTIPTSTLAGATVFSSKLQLTETWSGSCTAREVQLYRVGTISSATTWDNQPGKFDYLDNPSAAKGHDSGCPSGNVQFDLTAEMKLWPGWGWKTFQVGLYADETDEYAWKKFSPKVDTSGDYGSMITLYNHPPKQPTAVTMATSPTTACASTAAAATIVGDGDVTLGLTPSDADHQKVGVAFHVFTPSGTFVWQSGDDGREADNYVSSTYSATTGSYTQARAVVRRATLETASGNQPTEFMWQAQVWDGIEESYWGPNCHFKFDKTTPGQPTVTEPAGMHAVVGQPVTFAVSATGAASFRYQLNGGAPLTKAADSAGNAVITVTPTRIRNQVEWSASQRAATSEPVPPRRRRNSTPTYPRSPRTGI